MRVTQTALSACRLATDKSASPEAEVNAVLRAFTTTTRPCVYLVDEGFLSREGGSYRRSGGTVEI